MPLPARTRQVALSGAGLAEEVFGSARRSAAAPGPSLVADVARQAATTAAGTPLALSRTRSAAAAASSAIAIAVAASSRPSASRAPAPVVERRKPGAADRDLGLAEAPGAPEAVGDHHRGRRRRRRAISARIRRAEASGSSGSSADASSPARWRCRCRRWRRRARAGSRRSARRARRAATAALSSRTSCDQRRVLVRARAASSLRPRVGPHVAEATSRPSALETTFCETTTTSPALRARRARRDQLAEPGRPRLDLGQAGDRETSPGSRRSQAERLRGASAAEAAPCLELARERDQVGGGVEVERQRGEPRHRAAEPARRAPPRGGARSSLAEGRARSRRAALSSSALVPVPWRSGTTAT